MQQLQARVDGAEVHDEHLFIIVHQSASRAACLPDSFRTLASRVPVPVPTRFDEHWCVTRSVSLSCPLCSVRALVHTAAPRDRLCARLFSAGVKICASASRSLLLRIYSTCSLFVVLILVLVPHTCHANSLLQWACFPFSLLCVWCSEAGREHAEVGRKHAEIVRELTGEVGMSKPKSDASSVKLVNESKPLRPHPPRTRPTV